MVKLAWRLFLLIFGIGIGVTVQAKTASKTYANTKRADNLAQAHANLARAHAALAAQVGNVSFTGSGTLNVNALANLNNSTNTAFLAGLSKLGHQTTTNNDAGGTDPNTGPSWASGERGYVNNSINSVNGLVNAVNILQSHLQANGFES